jgi:hypothetical protein
MNSKTILAKSGYGNFQWSLSARQQQDIQQFLRALPVNLQASDTWKVLYTLTYTFDWSPEPRYPLPDGENNA